MSDEPGDHLAHVIGALSELFHEGITDGLGELLAEKVVWDGIFPNEICHGRHEVLGSFTNVLARPLRLTRIEAEEEGDLVAVSVGGPDFASEDRLPAGTPRSLVFDFSAGRVIRMQSIPTRDEAFRKLRAT